MKADRKFRTLVINPGSTSTKIAVFEGENPLWEKNISHSSAELEQFRKVWDQYDFRKKTILAEMAKRGCELSSLSAVVGRGGLLPPIESGTYRVNNIMIDDLRAARRGEHASNLGPVLAYGIAWDLRIDAYTVDPVTVDELEPLARYSGVPEIPRDSVLHALNIRAVARKYSEQVKKPMESMNLIVTHMGGGITACALRAGRMIDVNNGLTEGPFTPERAGYVPNLPLVDMCFSGTYTRQEMKEKLIGKGGLVAYLGTNSAKLVESLSNAGNTKAREVYEAMAYQISREIGSRAAVLKGEVDAIVLTGGLAHSKMLTEWITERVKFIAPVVIIPGEDEMEALALGALRVLRGEESAKRYGDSKKTVGVVIWESLSEYEIAGEVFERALGEAGYKFRLPDENIELLYRNCNESDANCRTIMRDFLDMKVDMIYSIGTPIVSTVKKMLMGKSVPVVCAAAFDPLVMGLIRDGEGAENNITGSYYRVSLADQIDRGLVPIIGPVKKLGIVHTQGELHSEIQLDEARKLAHERGFKLYSFSIQCEDDMLRAADYFVDKKIDALFLLADTTISVASRKVIHALASRIPTLCALKSTLMKGGLVACSADITALCEKSARIAVRILSGEEAHRIPFAGPEEQQILINLQTAAALNITIPEEVRKQASELIT